MGDRGQARIDYRWYEAPKMLESSIYLYTHWNGRELPGIIAAGVKAAVDAGRGNDEPYATRIIIAEMERAHSHSDTGMGVAPFHQDSDGYPTIVLDILNQQVWLEGARTPKNADWNQATFEQFATLAKRAVWVYSDKHGYTIEDVGD